MEFLDSLEQEGEKHKRKARRHVQSWYMYEQFKSLEENQKVAAERLKRRTSQDKLLRRELYERRMRRTLRGGGPDPIATSDSLASTSDTRSSNARNETSKGFDTVDQKRPSRSNETFNMGSKNSSRYSLVLPECFSSSADGIKHQRPASKYRSHTPRAVTPDAPENHLSSVTENGFLNLACEKNLADDLKEELESVKKEITHNINMQMATEMEKNFCFDEYNKLSNECTSYDDQVLSDDDSGREPSELEASVCSVRAMSSGNVQRSPVDRHLCPLWDKLVTIAYQVIQLNHGNCYSDYSSQFMAAVLACDMIYRGVNRMCNYLQPYVLPIDFDDLESPKNSCHKKTLAKKRSVSKKTKKKKCKFQSRHKPEKKRYPRSVVAHPVHTKLEPPLAPKRECRSELDWQVSKETIHSAEIIRDTLRGLASNAILVDNTTDAFWLDEFQSKHSSEAYFAPPTGDIAVMANPMLKLAGYLDSLMENEKDFDT